MSLTGVQVIREYIFFVVQKLERGEMIKWIKVSRTHNKKSLINSLPISNNTFTSLLKNRKERERKKRLKYGEGKKYIFVVLQEKTDHNIYYPRRSRVCVGRKV